MDLKHQSSHVLQEKQLIVLPLAHVNKVVINSYAWLQLFLFFQNP